MASKKAAPKKKSAPVKKAVSARTPVKSKFTMNTKQKVKAKSCLEKTGKITIGMKEIVFTKLPKSFDPPVSID